MFSEKNVKRYKHLFEQIVSLDNILLAHHKARKNKTTRRSVKRVDKNTIECCKKIQTMLIEGTYQTSNYSIFTIYEPKERQIYRLPYYPDRIIHHAIMNILEKIWVDQMIPNTYSCIKGRGIHKCLSDVKKGLRDAQHTKYCLKLDIRKFYPSIDHDILKQIIRIKIADKKVLKLLDHIIDSADGVPIGNYLSQFFANLYLAYFDRMITDYLRNNLGYCYYYRYADDIVILAEEKEILHKLLVEITSYLKFKLKLEIKPNYQVFPVESRGVDFVGYVIYHKKVLIRKKIKYRFLEVNNKLQHKHVNLRYYKRKTAGYIGWFKYCNSYNFCIKYFIYSELLELIKQ